MLSAAVSVGAVQPHIVLMAVDDLGWADVGFHGSNFPTPHLNRLAEEGVKLDKFYVQQVCSPTRSALMTARYPFRTGLQHVTTLMPGSTAKIPTDTATIAEVLKTVGYSTHAIGKWHLGYAAWKDTPIGRGFDSYAGYLQGGEDYYTHRVQGGMDFWRNTTAAWDAYGEHSMGVYMAEARRVLDTRDPLKPMFMYFAHQQVHAPLEAPPDSASLDACAAENVTSPIGKDATAGRHTLCTMASSLDAAIGTFVGMLKTRGMWDNTLLWLTTDNGGMTYGVKADGLPPIGVSTSSNWPLRGGKATLFEGGVRGVSFIAGGFLPDGARGQTRTTLMQHVDVPTTMAKLAGANWTMGTPDGYDLWRAIVHGAPSPRTEVPVNVDTCVGTVGGPPCSHHSKFNALISSKWKLIEANWWPPICPNTTWCAGAGLYDGWWTNDPYTHIAYNSTQGPISGSGLERGGLWLFDLDDDPNERHNVAASNPAIVHTMLARLAELADPANGYLDPQFNFPHPRAMPALHNGTWAPYRKLGEELPPLQEEYINAVLASLVSPWD